MPVAPRVGEGLREASFDELVGDDPWTRMTVTADLSGRRLGRLDVSDCRLVGCRLTGADLHGSRFVDVELVDCELSGATLDDAVWTRVSLRGCRMSGATLTSAKLRDVTVVECKADELGLRMAVIERVTFDRTMLRDGDLYAARLEGCRLFDCDLGNVQFSSTVFTDVRLHGSDLSGLRGIESMRGVIIDPDQVADFTLGLLASHEIVVTAEREPQPK